MNNTNTTGSKFRKMTFDTIETPKSDRNLGESLGCARCRAKVNEKRARWIHVIDGGGVVLHPDDEARWQSEATEEDRSGDLCSYPVGPECAKYFGEFLQPTEAK